MTFFGKFELWRPLEAKRLELELSEQYLSKLGAEFARRLTSSEWGKCPQVSPHDRSPKVGFLTKFWHSEACISGRGRKVRNVKSAFFSPGNWLTFGVQDNSVGAPPWEQWRFPRKNFGCVSRRTWDEIQKKAGSKDAPPRGLQNPKRAKL